MSRAISRLQAFLHDPPQKACALFTHERWADELLRRIGLSLPSDPEDPVFRADRMAAGADRLELPRKEETLALFKRRPEIVHPLSGWTIALPGLQEVGTLNLQEIARRALDALAEEALKEDSEEKRLARLADLLWRDFPEELAGVDRRRNLGILWNWLPADTRVPDHTIWDHQRLASAFVLAGERPALLEFSLGPVQPFIEGGRKLADLWGASLLLSRLAWAAMKAVAEALAPESILFPDLRGQPLADRELLRKKPDMHALAIPSLPNRFLALVPADSASDIGKAARDAAIKTLHKAAGRAGEIFGEALGEQGRARLLGQVESCFEFLWVSIPWPAGSKLEAVESWIRAASGAGIPHEDLARFVKELKENKFYAPGPGSLYGSLYRTSGRLMGGRKALRRFDAPAETGWKCSSCGEREPLPFPGDVSRKNLRQEWERVRKEDPALARDNEFLCGVCLVRRCGWRVFEGGQEGRFPSTSTLAAAPWIRRVCRKAREGGPLLEAVLDLVRAADAVPSLGRGRAPWRIYREFGGDPVLQLFLHLDGRLFFEETYESRDFEEEVGPDKVRGLQKTASSLLRKAKEAGCGSPGRYFAVIAADGDRMGKILSAEIGPKFTDVLHRDVRLPKPACDFLSLVPRPSSPAFHATISRILKDFSTKIVPCVVETLHDGDLIYAGGDDLLAVAPPLEALAIAGDLRRAWSGVEPEDAQDPSAGGFELGKWSFAKGYAYSSSEHQLCLVMGPKCSLSAGVAVAHHKAPLADTLRAARQALEGAKDSGRDALGLALLKRSGEHSRQAFSWRVKAGNGVLRVVDLLMRATEAFSKNLSPRLLAALQRFEPPPDKVWESPFSDLFRKHFTDHSAKGTQEESRLLAADLLEFGRGGGFRDRERPWKALLDLLKAGAFLMRGGEDHHG